MKSFGWFSNCGCCMIAFDCCSLTLLVVCVPSLLSYTLSRFCCLPLCLLFVFALNFDCGCLICCGGLCGLWIVLLFSVVFVTFDIDLLLVYLFGFSFADGWCWLYGCVFAFFLKLLWVCCLCIFWYVICRVFVDFFCWFGFFCDFSLFVDEFGFCLYCFVACFAFCGCLVYYSLRWFAWWDVWLL